MPAYNEMLNNNDSVRRPYGKVAKWIDSMHGNIFEEKHNEAKYLLKRIGIPFSIYKQNDLNERLIPFDMFPRIITKLEWLEIQEGVTQRALAINAFLRDIYNKCEIVKAKKIPADLIYMNPAYEIKMIGVKVPHNIYSPIIGTDIIRTDITSFKVLEDNCRTPSGVSYMIENREIMMRMFPELFEKNNIEPVENYSSYLNDTLKSLAPKKCDNDPKIVILTPGPLNSAYYEHSYLADTMGVELVQGSDLIVEKNITYMRTTQGMQKVDIIYRRIDDDFIDPISFNENSVIGVPGLFHSYKSGYVNICSAPGSGIADDKAIYAYMPEIIRFYLGEEPKLSGIKTWRCSKTADKNYVLNHLDKLVVKEVHGSGGYGMLIGNSASKSKLNVFKKKISNNPNNYIAQPILDLSSVPIFKNKSLGTFEIFKEKKRKSKKMFFSESEARTSKQHKQKRLF